MAVANPQQISIFARQNYTSLNRHSYGRGAHNRAFLRRAKQMIPWPAPARIGDPVEAVDTPALIVELDPPERNLARMANAAKQAGVALRPHAKMHKCVAVRNGRVEELWPVVARGAHF